MAIVFRDVGFGWPTGQTIFEKLNLTLEDKVYALVGVNGVGKTTFARLMTGELPVSSGRLIRDGEERIGMFRQVEDPTEELVESYAKRGLAHLPPELHKRRCRELSGGEWMRVRLAEVMASGAGFVILDEPTNHLDAEGRMAVKNFIQNFRGGVLLISHDRSILREADEVIEITPLGVGKFGFGWEAYCEAKEQERARLLADLERAKQGRERASRQRQELLESQERRQRRGKANKMRGGLPKILLGARQRQAEATHGMIDVETREKSKQAVTEAWEAYSRLKVDPVMYARLPAVKPPSGKVVLECVDYNFKFSGAERFLWSTNLNGIYRGGARIAVRGLNGAGKSTFLDLLLGRPVDGVGTGTLRLGNLSAAFLAQGLLELDLSKSILENVRESAGMSEGDVRGLLAMFLFRAEDAHKACADLSGGELLRAALAKILIREAPPELLILDEPTNNLDLANIRFLEEMLVQYQGALIVVSHDEDFLAAVKASENFELVSALHRISD